MSCNNPTTDLSITDALEQTENALYAAEHFLELFGAATFSAVVGHSCVSGVRTLARRREPRKHVLPRGAYTDTSLPRLIK